MANWACGHRRTSPLAGTDFSGLANWPGHALAAVLESGGLFPRDLIHLELAQRHLKCPACADQDRRIRRSWALLIAAALVLLLTSWRLRG